MTRDHPYAGLPDEAFWRRAVVERGIHVDPAAGTLPPIARTDRIATAGSCFAQNIARYLKAQGYNFLVTESAHPILPEEVAVEAGYGVYSARYGNIYTSLQLLQLFDRAYGAFSPEETVWELAGGFADPLRPTIQPGGFASLAELEQDRRQHLARVREMFETLDIFVFTLGLTESWISKADGTAFPVCPGVAGGRFDPARYAFHNLRAHEVIEQLNAFVARLASVNPAARIIFTVSPVPLVATAVPGGHVLAQTTYSKSVLRVAAQEVADTHSHVHYFPSYEIITGAHAGYRDFASDMRNVTEAGVARVMGIFLKHIGGEEPRSPATAPVEAGDSQADVAEWVEVMCDEALLDPALKAGRP